MRWPSVILLAALLPRAAHAQFYDLDGAYRCVTAPDAACAAAEATPPPTPQPTPKEKEAAAMPSLAAAIGRVKKGAPQPADIRLLEQRAEAKDPRAVEVLGWCNLNGIGMKPDPLQAFYLYRDAADLGVPNARKNEIAIFERRLSSAERQEVLTKQDAH